LRQPRPQLIQPLARQRRHLKRVGIASSQAAAAQRVDCVDLVQHELAWERVCADLAKHGVDRMLHLRQPSLGHGRVEHVEEHVGDERLLERRGEPFDELVRQAAHEADRVRDEVAPAVVLEAPRRRIERLEQAVVNGHTGSRQRVQQRRLADVRVTRECDRRRLCALPLLPPCRALARERVEAAAEERRAPAREPAVRLELRLARPTGADAAAEPLEVLPHPAHPRQVVLELGELDLELSLGTNGVLGEDVEDQLRPVDDARVERVLERALLSRVELVVDQEDLRARVRVGTLQLLELAFADVRPRVGLRPTLHEIGGGVDACGPRKLTELGKLFLGVGTVREDGEREAALGFRARCRIRLAGRHGRIMPLARASSTPAEHDLAARTLALVDIHSPSFEEQEIAEYVAREMPWPPTWREGETLWYSRASGEAPLVVLAGHLDTVPANRNFPGRVSGDVVHGLGASDMKGGLAVMIELAVALARARTLPGLAAGFLFFPREEVSVEQSPLPDFFATGALRSARLVVVLEPTDNEIQVGCVGSINARLRFSGRSAHTARPWLGDNAIDRAVASLSRVAGLPPTDVEVEGLPFREVLSLTRISGGRADNVVPDAAEATLNFRYAPHRSRTDAERRLRELAGDVEILSHSPAASVAVANPLVQRLRELGGFQTTPKQAWTPVAQFAELGIDAVNFGPGATRYAHAPDEQVEVAALERSFGALRTFFNA
jgi:succinyl-diaminopimelate desuccinylase